MKKLWMIILAVMLVFGLVLGCDEDNSSSNTKKPVDTKCKCTVAGCTCPGSCTCVVNCDCGLCRTGSSGGNCECGKGGCTCETPCPSGCDCECCDTTNPGGCTCGKTGCECTDECDNTCPCCGTDPGTPVYCKYCDEYYGSNEEAAHYGECYCLLCIEDWVDCECPYIARQLTLLQNGENGLPEVGDDHEAGSSVEAEKATGKGYFDGKQFDWVKNAKRGDKILVRIYGGNSGTGTNNSIQWGNCGAVGVKHLERHEDKRVDLTFGASGLVPNPTAPVNELDALEFYVAIEDLWRVNTFEEVDTTYAYVNAWASGNFFVKDAFFCIPKTPVAVTDVTPTAKDFYITATFLHYLDDGPLAPVFIRPRYNMSQGVITISYGASGATAPTDPGLYNITFDVGASTGFTAATGLVVGTLDLRASAPPTGLLSTFMSISGFDVPGMDVELEAGTYVPQYNAADNPMPPLSTYFTWVGGDNRPMWDYENDAWVLRLRKDTDNGGNFGVRLNIPFQAGDTITVTGYAADDYRGQVLVNSGDWNVIGPGSSGGGTAVNWSINEGATFNITGEFQADEVNNVRIQPNTVTAGDFIYITSITIVRAPVEP